MLACASLVRLQPRSCSHAGRGPLLASVIVDERKGCCYREADAPDEEEGPNRVEISGNVQDQSHYSAPCCQPDESRRYRPHCLILGRCVKYVIARTSHASHSIPIRGLSPRSRAACAPPRSQSRSRAELVAPVHAGYLQAPAVRGRLCDASTCAVDRRPGDGHCWCAQEPPQLGACRPPPSPRASSQSKLSSYAAPVVSPPCERCLPCSPGSRPSQREATASGRPSRH